MSLACENIHFTCDKFQFNFKKKPLTYKNVQFTCENFQAHLKMSHVEFRKGLSDRQLS